MKKILLSACLLAATTFAFAQKPANGDHSFTFGLSGINTLGVATPHYTGTLLVRHYLSDNLAARVALKYNSSANHSIINQEISATDSIKSNHSASNFGISVGMQYIFKGTDRLETYIGADIYYGRGSSKGDSTFTESAAISRFAGEILSYTETSTGPKTSTFGFLPCIGMNYYFTDWLAIGAEFSWGLLKTSSVQSGTISTGTLVQIDPTDVNKTITTTTTGYANTSNKNSGFNTYGHGMITITAAFR